MRIINRLLDKICKHCAETDPSNGPEILFQTVTIAPGNLPPGRTFSADATVNGATLATGVVLNPPNLPQGVGVVSVRVVATNIVRTTFINISGAVVTPGPGEYNFTILRSQTSGN